MNNQALVAHKLGHISLNKANLFNMVNFLKFRNSLYPSVLKQNVGFDKKAGQNSKQGRS